MRSKLFVPGSRPELFPKALASPADALSFDLEDAVVHSRKSQARQALAAFMTGEEAKRSNKTMIVRSNALGTPYFKDDIHAIVGMGVKLLNLPKVESADEVNEAVLVVSQAEEQAGCTATTRLLLNIESPKGLRNAAAIACANSRVVGLQLGYGDLFEPLKIARYRSDTVHATLYAVRMAAGEAGVFAYDAAYTNVADSDGYLAEARMARAMGFLGKSCIHPRQVALANDAFMPSIEEVQHALKIVQADTRARSEGVGAYLLDGKMIDAPFVRSAEALVEQARLLGLIASDGQPKSDTQ